MYDYIKGLFTYKNSTSKGSFATIETNGIGYSFEILERDYNILPEEGENLKFYTVLIHKEEKMSLCGFLKREDRDIFNVLTSVSGVGSKMALALLNSFKVSDLISFVIEGDYKKLTSAKGVGPKLAQKIILELKDKLNSYTNNQNNLSVTKSTSSNETSNQNMNDAQMVLLSLGYEKAEAISSIEKACKTLSNNPTAEEILQKSLQILSI